MLGIPKHEEAPPTPQHPLSPMGDACSRMDLTAIHQILVMTHYKDDEGTNEVLTLRLLATCKFLCHICAEVCYALFLVIFSRMDTADEGYARGKEAWRLGI